MSRGFGTAPRFPNILSCDSERSRPAHVDVGHRPPLQRSLHPCCPSSRGGFAELFFSAARWGGGARAALTRLGAAGGTAPHRRMAPGRLSSLIIGCPHLFADRCRRWMDTRRERCLHANEHGNFLSRVHEGPSQTAPSGNTMRSDLVMPGRKTTGGWGKLGPHCPGERFPAPAHAPGITQELSPQRGGRFLLARPPGDARINLAGVV